MEVDNEVYIVHIESSCRNVRRYEYLDFVVLERSEGSCSLSLFEVSVEESGSDTVFHEHSREMFRFVLGSCKDDDLLFSDFSDVLLEKFELVECFDFDERVVDLGNRKFFSRLDEFVVDSWLATYILREKTLHFCWDGRGESHRLFYLREVPPDVVDVFYESHVEHSVTFVEDEVLDLSHVDVSSVDQVDETSRSRDDNLWSLVDDFLLLLEARSTKNNRRLDSHSIGKLEYFVSDLAGEFSSWSENNCLWSTYASINEFEEGKHECRRLTRTCL